MTRTRKKKRKKRSNCERAFTNGSLHQTHLPTTTFPVQLISNAQQPGSLKGLSFGNGKTKEGLPYFGSMGNVRHV